MVKNLLNWSGFGNEGDDVCGLRYRLDCRRSCSEGQRPFRVADCPLADSWGRASSRRSLTGQEQSPSMVLFATAKGRLRTVPPCRAGCRNVTMIAGLLPTSFRASNKLIERD